MPVLILLLSSVGLAFFLSSKVTFLYTVAYKDVPHSWWRGAIASAIECSFCMGFWSGFTIWLLAFMTVSNQPLSAQVALDWFMFSLASAAFNVIVDSITSHNVE